MSRHRHVMIVAVIVCAAAVFFGKTPEVRLNGFLGAIFLMLLACYLRLGEK